MSNQKQQQKNPKDLSSEELRNIFDQENFNPIKYINQNFPDENSLQDIDSHIETLKHELGFMEKELTDTIHSHALNNSELQSEIQQAHQTTYNIIQEINTIKEKAEKSENLVNEMCKDIKQLDIAKKNLTFSITSLKKFNMMMTAVDKLRECCENKIYREVANLISAFEELSLYFKRYSNIPQILDLFKEKDEILKELKIQLKEDFEAYNRQATTLRASDMVDACSVVEAMGQQFKSNIVSSICGLVLNEYNQTFKQVENNNLETYERRFKWLQRNLKDFENRWNGVFPEYWAVSNDMVHEFCGITRLNLTEILEKQAAQTDVKELMTSLSLTLSFEQGITKDMEKRYADYLQIAEVWQLEDSNDKQEKLKQFDNNLIKQKEERSQYMISRLPKFKGSISASFEPHLMPYIQQEEKQLIEYINTTLQDQSDDKISDLNVLNSSLYMFNYIKQLIKRANHYSRTQLMSNITEVVKRGLVYYSQQLQAQLAKEDKIKNSNPSRFIAQVGYIINTTEYCNENMAGLEEMITDALDQPFQDQIDVSEQEDHFIQTLHRGIELLLQHIGKIIDPRFNEMLKSVNYGNVQDMEHTLNTDNAMNVKSDLFAHVKELKLVISEVQFISYLNKLVVLINSKILGSIYRFQKFESGSYPQLMSDVSELENCLKELGKLDSDHQMTSYDNVVKKIFEKTKKLLKLLSLSAEQVIANFDELVDEPDQYDIEKLLKIKGIKHKDAGKLAQYIQKK